MGIREGYSIRRSLTIRLVRRAKLGYRSPTMHTISSLRKTLGLATTNQVRNRIDSIRDVLAPHLRRGPNNQLLISDDDNLLAFASDTTGFRQYDLHFKDLRTGQTLPDTAQRVTTGEWAADNRTFFFTTEDPVTKRSDQVWRLSLGGNPVLPW